MLPKFKLNYLTNVEDNLSYFMSIRPAYKTTKDTVRITTQSSCNTILPVKPCLLYSNIQALFVNITVNQETLANRTVHCISTE